VEADARRDTPEEDPNFDPYTGRRRRVPAPHSVLKFFGVLVLVLVFVVVLVVAAILRVANT
jgi:hypothetical protein